MLRVVLAAWVLAVPQLAAQTVEGQVVNSVNGAGIPGATVYLIQGESIAYTATTGSLGHFRVDGVKEATYTWNYKAAGFMELEPSFMRGPSAAPPLRITSGGEPAQLKIELMPSCKVTGRVLDASGTPVPNAAVQIKLTISGGQLQFRTKTNEKGEYSRTEQLPAGTVTVSATPPSSWKAPESRDGQDLGWTQTFYPDATDEALALAVPLGPGGEAADLNIKLAPVPVHRLRGVVLDLRGEPVAKASVNLLGTVAFKQETKSDGTFEFRSLASGEWGISSSVLQDGIRLWAGEIVEVKDRDAEKVELRLTTPFSVPGKMIVVSGDGTVAGKSAGAALLEYSGNRAGVAKMPTGPLFPEFVILASQGEKNGDFTIKNVYPGTYMIVTSYASAQYYVDSIKVGDRDAMGVDVPILSGALPIVVTYKTDGGKVRGTVEACGSGGVLLVAQESALRRSEFLPEGNCTPTGRFEIGSVRPGEYYAIALHRIGMVGPDAFDSDMMNQSTRITVRAHETTSVDLRLSKR